MAFKMDFYLISSKSREIETANNQYVKLLCCVCFVTGLFTTNVTTFTTVSTVTSVAPVTITTITVNCQLVLLNY